MSKNSSVPGKTPWQVERALSASHRQVLRGQRTTEEQLKLLDERPGNSARERKRLTS